MRYIARIASHTVTRSFFFKNFNTGLSVNKNGAYTHQLILRARKYGCNLASVAKEKHACDAQSASAEHVRSSPAPA